MSDTKECVSNHGFYRYLGTCVGGLVGVVMSIPFWYWSSTSPFTFFVTAIAFFGFGYYGYEITDTKVAESDR